MKVKITNVPVQAYATVEIEVENTEQETLQHAVRELSQADLRKGLDGEIELDVALLDGGWELEAAP